MASAAVSEFNRYLSDLRTSVGNHLASALRSNHGRFISTKNVPDEGARERQAKRDRPEWFDVVENAQTADQRKKARRAIRRYIESLPERTSTERLDLGPCSGWEVVEGSAAKPRAILGGALERISNYSQLILSRRSHEWSNPELVKMAKELREIPDEIEDAAALLSKLEEFTSAANIGRLAQWLNSVNDDADYKAQGAMLVYQDGNRQLAPPANVRLPPMPFLDAMQDILGGEKRMDVAA